MATEDLPDDVAGPSGNGATAKANALYETYSQDVQNASNAGEAMRICLDAAESFAELAVEAPDGEADRINSMAEAYLNQLSDTKNGVARKNIRAHWRDTRETLEKEKKVENGDAVVFSDLIERTLQSVTKKVTTDESSTEDTKFELEFDDGNNTKLTVTQSVLFEGRALWKTYTSAQEGEYPDRVETEEVEWDNFIGSVIEEVGETIEERPGPRTAALQSLENHVSNAAAYGNRSDAVEKGAVYVDDEPPANDEVLVPREAVASIISTHEITDRALQEEISARELTGPTTSGKAVAMSTTLNGNWQTFWCLSADAFDVDEDAYKDEAEDAMDRMDAVTDANTSDSDDTDSDTSNDADEVVNDDSDSNTESDDSDDEDDHEPGKIGSVGPGTGGDE